MVCLLLGKKRTEVAAIDLVNAVSRRGVSSPNAECALQLFEDTHDDH